MQLMRKTSGKAEECKFGTLLLCVIILAFFELKVTVCQLSLVLLGFWGKSNLILTIQIAIFSDLSSHLQYFQSLSP